MTWPSCSRCGVREDDNPFAPASGVWICPGCETTSERWEQIERIRTHADYHRGMAQHHAKEAERLMEEADALASTLESLGLEVEL